MTPGIFAFFPGAAENKQAGVVICPGGGYNHLSYVSSGLQLAKWFNTMGISAFVLNYRLPNSPDLIHREIAPLMDAQRAIRHIRSHAAEWHLNPEKIGIMGCSAGGHLAACASVLSLDVSRCKDSLDRYSFRPNFTILVSAVIDMFTSYAHLGSKKNLLGENPTDSLKRLFSPELQVTDQTPPCFITDAVNDKTVNPMNSLLYYEALLKHKIPVSFHAFPQGGHSIGLRNNPGSTNLWTVLCEQWLTEMNIIK
jgi:acetyl esterase/lipase